MESLHNFQEIRMTLFKKMKFSRKKEPKVYCIVFIQHLNIHVKDTQYCQHSVHTDNNKYIKFKVPNIIIKIKLKN
jgi:hypothetical protein